MIDSKKKIITVLFTLLLGLIFAGSSAFYPYKGAVSPEIYSISELKGRTLGGVKTKMPENSTKILFDGILGLKLLSYRAYNTVDEVIYALSINEVQAAWFSDVTAKYLLRTREGLRELSTSDIVSEDRLDFAMALKLEDEELKDDINLALSAMKENGKLKELTDKYIDLIADELEPLYEKDMEIRKKGYSYSDTIYVGITGMTLPIEQLDISNKPYGFCVSLMDEIAQMNGINVEFIYISNEAAFSSLMGGKIDVLFCYGTSYSTLDPDNVVKKRSFIMTDGYYSMNKYSLLCLD